MQQWIIDNLSTIFASLTTGGFGIGYFHERKQRKTGANMLRYSHLPSPPLRSVPTEAA